MFDVSPIGGASYQIPINLPFGTGGVAPKLSVVYSSSGKDGLLGSGFDLSGLSIINRCPENLHSDGKVEMVNFASTDNFMLDGNRLNGVDLSGGRSYEYRTENNTFVKVIAFQSTTNPSYFIGYTKDGLTYTYSSNNSQLKSTTTASNNTLFWLLTKVNDNLGNIVEIITTPNDTRFTPRSQKSTYDTSGHFIIEDINNLGFVTKRNYNLEYGYINYEIDQNNLKTKYLYNSFGEVVTQKNPNGLISYEYDKAGRVQKETTPEETLTYYLRYPLERGIDTGVIKQNSISESFKYDTSGRIIEFTETVDSKTFVTKTSYETKNRIEFITYPSGLRVQHTYTLKGHLATAKNPSSGEIYWQMNARGQVEEYSWGSKKTVMTNDPVKGSISSAITPDLNVLNWTYKFDSMGNLIEHVDKSINKTEKFEYDKENRLVKVYHNGVLKQEMNYDIAGNLTFKTGLVLTLLMKKVQTV